MPCVTLGNTKSQEYGRPRDFGVTQSSISSTMYTPSKDVIKDYGFVHIYCKGFTCNE